MMRTTDMIPDEKVNILLVDDQPAKLLSYEAVLGELDENLIKASSGTEALEVLLKNDVAVILVDVCMPEQDGFELAEMIRGHHRFKQTAIIFISAVQMDDMDRLKGYASGAVDYVSVPVVPEILRAKVSVFVDLFRKTRQLERLNSNLEQEVARRTAELEKAREKLQQADRRKDEFLATLAHELRNPLAPIQNSLEIIRRSQSEDRLLATAASTMARQVSQMARLIDDLMDVSRITRNKLELRKDVVLLADIVKGALELSRPSVEAERHRLVVDVPNDDIYLDADRVRVSQVIANLLNNAAKYTPRGGEIRLKIGSSKNKLHIEVSDNGIGIGAEDLPNLFEPFYQVHRSVERSQGGLGIGLTLVKTIVEKHGGQVRVESEGHGKGTKFEVIMNTIKPPENIHDASGAAGDVGAAGASHRVLVVDDNQDAAESLCMLLETCGHAVKVAHSGPQALAQAADFRPELVFMDIGMPGMSGYETARALRQQPWGNPMMLVALTGWGQEEDRRKTAEAGFDRHLVKPVEFEVVNRLFAELDQPPARTPAVSSTVHEG